MNLKSSLIFFSAGVILILFLFLMGAVPMDMLPESSQQQEQNDDRSDLDIQLKSDGDDEEGQLTTAEESIIPTKTKSKPIDQMDCAELKKFAFSFEAGWGNAVALHDERCT